LPSGAGARKDEEAFNLVAVQAAIAPVPALNHHHRSGDEQAEHHDDRGIEQPAPRSSEYRAIITC
jgi:hypothetical protein